MANSTHCALTYCISKRKRDQSRLSPLATLSSIKSEFVRTYISLTLIWLQRNNNDDDDEGDDDDDDDEEEEEEEEENENEYDDDDVGDVYDL